MKRTLSWYDKVLTAAIHSFLFLLLSISFFTSFSLHFFHLLSFVHISEISVYASLRLLFLFIHLLDGNILLIWSSSLLFIFRFIVILHDYILYSTFLCFLFFFFYFIFIFIFYFYFYFYFTFFFIFCFILLHYLNFLAEGDIARIFKKKLIANDYERKN